MRYYDDGEPDSPFDRNGVLRDGARFSVPMLMRDAAPAQQHVITDADRRRMALDRATIHPELRDEAERARQEWIASLNVPPQRDAATAAPPHVPAPRPNSGNRPAAGQPLRDAVTAQAARDAGYAQYVADLTRQGLPK